jgi:pimeloyl-ACP methyl ester carboxylesterase
MSFIWGTADQFFDPEPGQEVAERMSNAEFHLLDNYGHMPWLEPDSEVGGLVREFLDG